MSTLAEEWPLILGIVLYMLGVALAAWVISRWGKYLQGDQTPWKRNPTHPPEPDEHSDRWGI